MNPHRLLGFVAIPVLALAACSMSVSPDLVKKKAASDLACGQQMKVEQITDNNWKVSGCGQTVTYVCSGSTFMSDGMCMRESAVPTSATLTK